jgi:uncharacterized protein (TIGR02145 family)
MNKLVPIFLLVFLTSSCYVRENLRNKKSPNPFSDNHKWGFVNLDKKIIIAAIYDDALSFSDGLAAVKSEGKWGYINEAGDQIIPPRYSEAGSFSGGRAMVCQNGKWGFIDSKGKEVIPPVRYDIVGDFSEELAMACLDNKFGFIDKNGKVKVGFSYDYVWKFMQGIAKVLQNHRFGYINKKGEEIIPVKYDFVGDFYNDLALAEQDMHWALINRKGEVAATLDYDYVWEVNQEGYYKVLKDEKYGFIDYSGKEKILMKYQVIDDYYKDLAIVKNDGKLGMINRDGREVIRAEFDELWHSDDNLGTFKKGQQGGYVDFIENKVITESFPGNELNDAQPDMNDTRDNQNYSTVKVGSQIWIAENLKYPIPGSRCLEILNLANCETFGRYYDWNAALKACPAGWRLPTLSDWEGLSNYLGGNKKAFEEIVEGGNSGLNLKFGGLIIKNGTTLNIGEFGYFWTSTSDPVSADKSYCIWLNSYENSTLHFSSQKSVMRNVRCIKE